MRFFLPAILLLVIGCHSDPPIESSQASEPINQQDESVAVADAPDATAATGEPFEITFVKNARWTEGRAGFDPKLPGYHLTGDISTIKLRPRAKVPQRLVLAIRTSPGMRPNLESFSLLTDSISIRSHGLANIPTETRAKPANGEPWRRDRAKPGTYFQFTVVGQQVHVTFLPAAMALLQDGGTVSWIDWYRR